MLLINRENLNRCSLSQRSESRNMRNKQIHRKILGLKPVFLALDSQLFCKTRIAVAGMKDLLNNCGIPREQLFALSCICYPHVEEEKILQLQPSNSRNENCVKTVPSNGKKEILMQFYLLPHLTCRASLLFAICETTAPELRNDTEKQRGTSAVECREGSSLHAYNEKPVPFRGLSTSSTQEENYFEDRFRYAQDSVNISRKGIWKHS
nr:hypothetical protein Iba_chr04eCG6870 [Ipomoea batatas]